MIEKTILHINSSGRYSDSITRQVSELVVEHLKESATLQKVIKRDVAVGVPFINEVWINSNFTAPEERTEEQKTALSFSDELVAELKKSDYIVMATPIYNFSIPAVLKAWIDLIARAGLTFSYTENGPVGLLENKKAIVVMASGGVPIGSEMDMASGYLKFVLGFIGIHDVTIIDASVIDYLDDDENTHRVKLQIAGLIDLKESDIRRKK